HAMQTGCRECRANRDDHPGRADQVSGARTTRRREAFERDDEANGRKQIDELDRVGAAHWRRPRALNISSMRSVTTKPPTALTVASTTATNPSVSSTAP